MTGGLTFGAVATSTKVGSLDLSTNSASFAGPMLVRTNTTAANTITIGAGETLTVTGAVTIGTAVSGVNTNTRLNMTGAGSFVVNAPATTFQVGGDSINSTRGNSATLDMLALESFTANVDQLRIGDTSTGSGGGIANSTMILAETSVVTATSINLASQHDGILQTLNLGNVSNTLNVNTINVGYIQGRGDGTIQFAGATGDVTIRAKDGVSPAAINVATGTGGTAADVIGTVNFTGHTGDIKLSTLTIAERVTANSGGNSTGVFAFGTGTMDVDTIHVARKVGTNANIQNSVVTGTFTVGGGQVNVGSGGIVLSRNDISTGTGSAVSVLNLSGGELFLSTATSQLAEFTPQTGTQTATSTINFNGTTVKVAYSDPAFLSSINTTNVGNGGSIIDTNGFDLTINKILLDNGTGVTSGLTKLGLGTLTIGGANTYEGDTNINEGTLKLGAANRIPEGAGKGNVVLAPAALSTATLDLNGFAEAINGLANSGPGSSVVDSAAGAAVVTLTVGNNNATSTYSGVIQNTSGTVNLAKAGSGTLTLAGLNTYSGPTTMTGNGTLSINSIKNVGGGASSLGAPTTIADGTITLTGTTGGSINYTGTGDTTDRIIARAGVTTTTNFLANNGTGPLIWNGDITGTIGYTLRGSGVSALNGIFFGTSTLTKNDAGTWTLSGANTHTGTTAVTAGTLIVTNATSLGTTAGSTTVANGATLDVQAVTGEAVSNVAGTGVGGLGALVTSTGAGTLGGNVTMTADTTYGGAGNLTVNGVVSGTGFALTKIGSGTLALGGNNTFTGLTTITNGTLSLGNGGANGTLAAASGVVNNSNLTFDRTAALTFPNIISGTGTVTKINTNALTITGANTYDGTTFINRGILVATDNNSLGSGLGDTIINGADGSTGTSLQLSNVTGITFTENISILPAGAGGVDRALLTNSTGPNIFAGTITGAVGFTAEINQNAVSPFEVSGAINVGALTIRGGGTGAATLSGDVTAVGGIFKTDTNLWNIGALGKTYTFPSLQVADGTVAMLSSGVLDGKNVIIGQASATSGLLRLNGTGQAMASLIVAAGSTGTTNRVTGGSIVISDLTVDNTANITFSGIIGGAVNDNNLSLTKKNTGKFTISGANTYTGDTNINEGILALGTGLIIPDGPGNVNIAALGTLDL